MSATPSDTRPDHPLDTARRADLLEEAERLLEELKRHEDPDVGRNVEYLLEVVDIVHRAGLTHLVAAIQSMAGDAFLHRLSSDPAIRLLLMSYDLIAVDRRLMAEEALDPVRGHLHDHGIDVELAEVVGSVVYVRLHPPVADEDLLQRIRTDLETALREGLPGFQEVEIGDRRAASSGLVQMGGLRKARRPVYRDVMAQDELETGDMRPVLVGDRPVLLVRLDDGIHALGNQCGEGPLPLEFGELDGQALVCSWHGCRYDVRTGMRLDGGVEKAAVYPVRVSDGRVEIAVATEPVERNGDV